MVVALALALAAAYSVEAGYRVVRLGEVIALARDGVSDRTIISFLQDRELDFVVGTDEMLRLREAGVGEPVIRYLVERTAPRDPYSPGPYADREVYDDYGGSPYYDDPGYGGAYVEYGPSYYVGASLGPYVTYDRYYGGGLFGRRGRTFGFGHHYGRYYGNRYDYDRGHRYDHGHRYDGRSYRYDYGRTYRYDGGRNDGRSYSHSYRSNPSRGYRTSYGHATSHGSRGPSYGRDHAVPRGSGHSGGHSGGHGRH